ncbi:uncharacterized protein TRIVIDRAFT_53006 [Trichoderma virens Gv29-8]|uniref:Rhodopsin domain-containing protein n=1 Tax=Hypocrea virens (strain Gv29-8 / FGSC 10586) TaxID=413071 RepID=G9MV72_HYPVG|nr:uncharacterized protein TRIVIDRAFT_53006 [Trichoderma virens Gv29-8]EHK21657.1 hypothetical protein TRIVIDRAFT_53006 [Trichoderma virens Gv29-8]
MSGSRGPEALAVVITLYIISFIAIGLRFFTHGFILKHFFPEDYISLVALILYTAYTICAALSIKYGIGSHVVDVPPDDRPKAIFYRWIVTFIYVILSLLTKWIVGTFLLRICPRKRWRQITIWTILAVITVFDLIFLVFAIRTCQPISLQWTRYNPIPSTVGSCNPTTFATITTYIAAFINVIADWILPALPATLVWKAQIPQREKISIIVLLALGSIASIATIVRIPFARGYLDNPDYLYTTVDLGIWGTVEIGVALATSSFATLKPLLKKMRLFSNLSSSERLDSGPVERNNNTAAGRKITITNRVDSSSGPQEARESWRDRWGRKGSMDVELVGQRQDRYASDQNQDSDIEVGLHKEY